MACGFGNPFTLKKQAENGARLLIVDFIRPRFDRILVGVNVDVDFAVGIFRHCCNLLTTLIQAVGAFLCPAIFAGGLTGGRFGGESVKCRMVIAERQAIVLRLQVNDFGFQFGIALGVPKLNEGRQCAFFGVVVNLDTESGEFGDIAFLIVGYDVFPFRGGKSFTAYNATYRYARRLCALGCAYRGLYCGAFIAVLCKGYTVGGCTDTTHSACCENITSRASEFPACVFGCKAAP
jgi:hypothetical protein